MTHNYSNKPRNAAQVPQPPHDRPYPFVRGLNTTPSDIKSNQTSPNVEVTAATPKYPNQPNQKFEPRPIPARNPVENPNNQEIDMSKWDHLFEGPAFPRTEKK